MYVAIISAIVGIVSAYLLAPIYSVGGLALAFGISSYLNAILLYLLLAEFLATVLINY